jgi:hypothetical protein
VSAARITAVDLKYGGIRSQASTDADLALKDDMGSGLLVRLYEIKNPSGVLITGRAHECEVVPGIVKREVQSRNDTCCIFDVRQQCRRVSNANDCARPRECSALDLGKGVNVKLGQ